MTTTTHEVPVGDGIGLREYIEKLLEAHADVHRIHEVAHEREHIFTQTAVDKAEAANKEWRSASNEWRAAMKDRETEFATMNDMRGSGQRITDLEKAAIARDERERNRQTSEAEEKRQDERRQSRQQWLIGAIVAAFSIGVGVVLHFVQ